MTVEINIAKNSPILWPQVYSVVDRRCYIRKVIGDYTEEQMKAFVEYPDKPNYVPVWNGHEFESVQIIGGSANHSQSRHNGERVTVTNYSFQIEHREPHEQIMAFPFPRNPLLKEKDIIGATIFELVEEEGYFDIRHTEEGTHHDYELTLRGAAEGVFQPAIRQHLVDSMKPDISPARVKEAQEKYVLTSTFYGEVLVKAVETARSLYLGERHQSPHPREGYLDKDLTDATNAIKVNWSKGKKKKEDLKKIESSVTYVFNTLEMPDVETRVEMEARLEAERKAKEEDEG